MTVGVFLPEGIEAEVCADTRQVGGHHYAGKAVQPWDAMRAWMTPEQFEGYLRGNVIKYIARYPDKNGIEDVKKAQHYMEKLLEVLAEIDAQEAKWA